MLSFNRFQALTFDCYGTLIDWETGIFSVLRPLLAAHAKIMSDAQILELYSNLEAEAEMDPFRPYREVLQSVIVGFGRELGFLPSRQERHSLAASLARWKPFADTCESLRRLQARYRLAIISNVDDDLFSATAPQLGVTFDYVATAQRVRCYKPGIIIFQSALRALGVPAENVLHVGQSIYHDVIPAQSLGLATVWVNRASPRPNAGAAKRANGRPDLEVPDLKTLAQAATSTP